jgi:hypothetical protein
MNDIGLVQGIAYTTPTPLLKQEGAFLKGFAFILVRVKKQKAFFSPLLF